MSNAPELHIAARAYAKMILHATKYPHLAVNGVLLSKSSQQAADQKTSGGRQQICDAIPLFHQCLYVSPMAEVALTQIEAYAEAEGMQIAGYYAAAEHFEESSVERAPGLKLAEKIAENGGGSLVMIDNKLLGLIMDKPAVRAWHSVQSGAGAASRTWSRTDAVHIDQSAKTIEAVSELVQRSAARDLQDFDNYLDNTQNDWRNAELNRDLPQLLAMY